MKVKLFFENEKAIAKSGIGRALKHQQQALTLNHIPFTKEHKEKDFDILHINTVWFASWLEVKKAKKNGKKIVFHAHSTMEDFRNSFMFSNLLAPLYKKWLIYMYNFGDVIITPTPYSKSILEGYGITKKIYPVSNGIDMEQYKKDSEKAKKFREYFNLSEHQKTVISVGWLFERKGFDTFCEVAEKLPEYTFIWFGDKNLSAPTAKIRKIMANPPKNVILPGYISGDVIKGAYSGADLFFFPSREETEGIVVLESLASEIPVLVRDIPVYKGWLKKDVNCRMGKETEDFIRCIPEIMEHKYEDLTKEGYALAKTKTLDHIGKELKSIYEELMK